MTWSPILNSLKRWRSPASRPCNWSSSNTRLDVFLGWESISDQDHIGGELSTGQRGIKGAIQGLVEKNHLVPVTSPKIYPSWELWQLAFDHQPRCHLWKHPQGRSQEQKAQKEEPQILCHQALTRYSATAVLLYSTLVLSVRKCYSRFRGSPLTFISSHD